MIRTPSQAGFSAVELLISLFIAVAFIGAGYQLYAIIIKDGGETNLRAKANVIVYNALRRYAPQATNPCTVRTPTPTATIPPDTIAGATISANITCPYGTTDATSKLTVTVRYGSPQVEVTHAIFIANE